MTKTCATCKQAKHVSSFGKQKQKHDGLRCYCKDCDNARRRNWSANNRERQREIVSKAASKPERKEYARQYQQLLRQDPTIKYKQNLGRRIRTALARKKLGPKTKLTMDIVGCSLEYLAAHLITSAIQRYGYWLDTEEYHIDHIIPLAQAQTESEVNALNHYSNLQLLTPEENQVKGCR